MHGATSIFWASLTPFALRTLDLGPWTLNLGGHRLTSGGAQAMRGRTTRRPARGKLPARGSPPAPPARPAKKARWRPPPTPLGAQQGERDRGSGGSLEPPRSLYAHLRTVCMPYSERLPTRWNPLAERTCFSKVRELRARQVPGRRALEQGVRRCFCRMFETRKLYRVGPNYGQLKV